MKEQNNHLFPYKWYLKDGYPSKNISKNNYNIFGTFICGGGSTMGYKLAGFNHLGGVEIDPQVADIYKTNHNPKYLFNIDIREFNKLKLDDELYNLDILDGSPPCSTFSMAGSREKAWGKSKQFREGQANQILDDLVFVYCNTILKLKPKVFLLENVKGIIQGNAKWYSKKIVNKLSKDYNVQVFLLNAASMGVPQKRERVFFIGYKKEYKLPKLKLEFNEKTIPFGKISDDNDLKIENKTEVSKLWEKTKQGKSFSTVHIKGNFFNDNKSNEFDAVPTITADKGHGTWHFSIQRKLNNKEVIMCGTYPLDYNFKSIEPKYLIGMSVPPVMTAQISNQIRIQWLDRL